MRSLKKILCFIGAATGIIAKVIQNVLRFIVITFFLPPYINCVRIARGLLLAPDEMMSGGFWPNLLGLTSLLVLLLEPFRH